MMSTASLTKSSPILLAAFGSFVLVVLLLIFGGYQVWYRSGLQPVSADTTKQPFEVKQGESAGEIANSLKKQGLIKNERVFRSYTKQQKVDSKFAEGTYYIAPSMTVAQIVSELQKSQDIRITTIEGWRNEEIAQLLQDKMQLDGKEFLKQAKQGYMFPDTYQFNKKEVVADIVATMQTNFDKRVSDDIREKIKKQNITLEQGITLASIVEREARDSVPNERQMVASVLLKRLRMNMALEADATVQYALGYDTLQKKWWRVLSTAELKTLSPYNTYLQPGLPPGPIANPGLASIKAVAEASATPYLYYIHGKDGKAYFAKTLEEHTANQRKYL